MAYYPDETFEARLQAILPQLRRLVIVDNTPDPVSLSKSFCASWGDRLHCISNAENKGIAAAMNQGLKYALDHSHPWILTLDQDSYCYPNMVDILCGAVADCSPLPAVMGSNYVDLQNEGAKVSVNGRQKWLERKTVITSGCLVDSEVALKVGGFREDFFIDQVDHEFCLRLRSYGYRVVMSTQPTMAHTVGQTGGARLPFLGILPNHPPLRKYYIARNSIVTVATYWRSEPDWCIRRLVKLFLGLIEMATLEKQRVRKVHAFFKGLADGLHVRMGPCCIDSILRKDQT
nr:glycosyltransferase [uncultured Rhodoferax sp.]